MLVKAFCYCGKLMAAIVDKKKPQNYTCNNCKRHYAVLYHSRCFSPYDTRELAIKYFAWDSKKEGSEK